MVEGLHYASGSRFPIVMMNANRSIAAPWNIYGDQRDSLAELESGWIQLYAENAQERRTRFSRPTRSLRIPM